MEEIIEPFDSIKWLLHKLYIWLLGRSREQCPAVQEFAVYGLAALLSLNMVIILLLVASTRRQIARVEAENECLRREMLRLQMLTLDMIDTVTASGQSASSLPNSSHLLYLTESSDPLPVAESGGCVVNSVKSNADCTAEVDHAIDVIDNASSVTSHAIRVTSHANSTGSISKYSSPSARLEQSISSEMGRVLAKRFVRSSSTSRQRRRSELDRTMDVVDHASSVSSHANRATSHANSTGSISKLCSTPSAMTMTITPSARLEKSMSSESGEVLVKRHVPGSTTRHRRVSDRIRRQTEDRQETDRRQTEDRQETDTIRLRSTHNSSG